MFPPVFQLAFASTTVKTLFGDDTTDNPCRVWPFGKSPKDAPRPYAVWQTVTGAPENYLAGRPDADEFTIQLDVYGEDPDSTRVAAEALRDAFELQAYIRRWGGESTDPATDLCRYSFDVDFITLR